MVFPNSGCAEGCAAPSGVNKAGNNGLLLLEQQVDGRGSLMWHSWLSYENGNCISGSKWNLFCHMEFLLVTLQDLR